MAMEWTVQFHGDPGVVEVRTRGTFNLADYGRMIQDITSQPFWKPGLDALFDHRALDFGATGFEIMWSASSKHAANDAAIGRGRAAVLMKNLADYGRGRMFENLASDTISAQLSIFTDETKAREWLGL